MRFLEISLNFLALELLFLWRLSLRFVLFGCYDVLVCNFESRIVLGWASGTKFLFYSDLDRQMSSIPFIDGFKTEGVCFLSRGSNSGRTQSLYLSISNMQRYNIYSQNNQAQLLFQILVFLCLLHNFNKIFVQNIVEENGKNTQVKFQRFRKNYFTKIRKAEDLYRRVISSTKYLIHIGADLTTNLVILSPQLITLHDPELIKFQDCYNTFHFHKDYVGKKTRADHMIEICHRLNNKVYVDKLNTQINEEDCLKYDVIIFCDVYDIGRIMSINKSIRAQKNSKTVIMFAVQLGFFGMFVTDFGDEWEMFNSGIEFPKINIKNITNEERGKVNTVTPHQYKTGDFVVIKYVEGMKYVNNDARPVTVVDDSTFLIQDTRNFGTYVKGGICEKVDLVEKLKFLPLQDQLVKRHSDVMLFAKAAIAFFQNNSKMPGLFDENNEEEAMQLLRQLSEKINQKYEEVRARNFIKICEYSFYPLVNMIAAIISLEVVKCTGKYRPVNSPLVIDWSNKISFQVKKKVDNQIVNIIDTNTLQKLAQLQVGIVDDGHQSLQLLNLLYSCSIAEKNRVILVGLESINESKEADGLTLKAHVKYQVANDLFKSKKTETIPCSLSFSNDLLLSDVWRKIRVLINTSSKLNQYIYNNVIWNQIDILDSQISELQGIMKICAANKSQLKQRVEPTKSVEGIKELVDYKSCVEKSLQEFRLIFIDIFQDVRCFFKIGAVYIDRVKMEPLRKNIFLLIICCLEDSSFIEPQNIVKMCKYIFTELFPQTTFNSKDQLIMDYMSSMYYLISWFYTKKQPKMEEINNYFNQYINTNFDQSKLTQKEKYDIAFAKLAMSNTMAIPYLSLNQLFRKEHTVKLIWNSSQIHAKSAALDQDFSSKKFYKYYFRKLKPCPFISQILNSLIPISILQNVYGHLSNIQIDMIEGKVSFVQSPPPKPFKPRAGITLVPAVCNQWTIISIQGPKKVAQILQRFNYMQQVNVTKIRCENVDLYDKNSKKNIYLDFLIDSVPAIAQCREDKTSIELHIEAEDRNNQPCQVSRVKYVFR